MKRTYSFLIPILMSASFASNAVTCVSKSKITSVLIPNNGRTEIRIKTQAISLGQSAYNNGRIQMWEGSSYERWKQKRDLLLMAYSLNKPITMDSNDDNCMGNDDEFHIVVGSK
ncbi:hypothetical protein [Photobacterium leiognathi]|uniref:hypothetical protein n=1 Tax=Photobacterium leiognathi TaxID=553611 RepID=UPI00298158AB|nr:hypothetical protein [Photobacterium leiognathi]